MTQFAISILDNKASLFLEFMKRLSFVKEIQQVEDVDIPQWQKDVVRERMADYKTNPNQALDFDVAMDYIESELMQPVSTNYTN